MTSKRLIYQINRFLIGGAPVQNVKSFSEAWHISKEILTPPTILLEWQLTDGSTHRATATNFHRSSVDKMVYTVDGIEYTLEISEVKEDQV